MLVDPIDAPEERTADDLRREYAEALADVVRSVGVETAAAESAVARETLERLADGDTPEMTLQDACEILALSEDWSDPDAVRLEVRDYLMLGMSSAVLDVDALERLLDGGLTAKEIQAKLEGRQPMSLAEYASVALAIEREKDFT
ncbi:MAG: DUF5791 family protein [Halanaeroarchaeum sp.]